MKTFALAALLVLATPVGADEPPAAAPEAAAPSPLAAHVHPARIVDGKLTGPGGDLLTAAARDAHFLSVGESHASADVARAITALYRAVEPMGYDVAAIETSPYVARLLEERLSGDQPSGLEAYYKNEAAHVFTVPFYSWREEAEFLEAVVGMRDAPGPDLWGLDQEFIAGGPILLEALAGWAVTDAQKQAVAAARKSSDENIMWVAFASDEELEALETAFAGADAPAEARDLIELIGVSRRIYRPFTGQGGSAYLANRERENQMKTLFLGYYEAAEKALGRPPRVFLKFGANHLYRGRGYTDVLTLGSFVEDLGIIRGVGAFNLYATCLGGEVRTPKGPTAPCSSSFLPPGSPLAEELPDTPLSVVDLAAIRLDRDAFQALGDGWDEILWAFDALLVIRDSKPATFFEGTMPELPF